MSMYNHELKELNETIIEGICDAYLECNMPEGLEPDTLEVFQGLFMAGAATYFDLCGCLMNSKIPDDKVKDMVEENSMKAIELSHGKLIKMSVKTMEMPPEDEVH